MRAHEDPEQERGAEQRLDRDDLGATAAQESRQLNGLAPADQPAEGGHDQQDAQDRRPAVGQEAERAAEPEQIADRDQAQRPGERPTAVGQIREQPQGERQDRQTEELQRQPPADHHRDLAHAPPPSTR